MWAERQRIGATGHVREMPIAVTEIALYLIECINVRKILVEHAEHSMNHTIIYRPYIKKRLENYNTIYFLASSKNLE